MILKKGLLWGLIFLFIFSLGSILISKGNYSPIQINRRVRREGIVSTSVNAIKTRSNESDAQLFSLLTAEDLLREIESIRDFIAASPPHLERLRVYLFLYTIFQRYLPATGYPKSGGMVPIEGYKAWMEGALFEAEGIFYASFKENPSVTIVDWLSKVYEKLAIQARQDQVEESLEEALGHPVKTLDAYKLQIHDRFRDGTTIRVSIGGRLELDSIVGSDIFGIAMDFPEGSKVLNATVFLEGRDGKIDAPIEVLIRRIDEPVVRLISQDLGEERIIKDLAAIKNIRLDDLALLKTGLLATGIIPKDIEDASLEQILEKFGGGIEIITFVDNLPRGSGLAISSSLAVAVAIGLLQFSGQIDAAENPSEKDKMAAVVQGLRMEWLEISGGGYQDMAALWEGIHLITAQANTTPVAKTRGELLPRYEVFKLSKEGERVLEDSIIIAHLGLAQPAGPILDMITEDYYLRRNWSARLWSMELFEKQKEIFTRLKDPSLDRDTALALMREFGRNMAEDYINRITIVPSATNRYGEEVIKRLKERFKDDLWGWNTSGCRAGAGHIFVVNPRIKEEFMQAVEKIAYAVREEIKGMYKIPYPARVYRWRIADEGVKIEFLSPHKSHLKDNNE